MNAHGKYPDLAPQRSDYERERKLKLRAFRGLRAFMDMIDGGRSYACPVCGYEGRFSPVRQKPDLWCPACDSRPRHRLMKLWMDRELSVPPKARMLHFAAEPWIGAWFAPRLAEYVTADINTKFDITLDMTAIDLPDARFDIIMANHVLEHLDDRKALAELWRVLAPGGMVILSVPLVEGWDVTYEDPTITDPEDRLIHFTDRTHLRLYGRDFPDRVAAAGFEVSAYAALEPDVSRHALQRGEKIFVGRKPA
ncbi:methyltransferase domain-containing protein [Paroceanicella profunda]|uniref:Methyltransferase domain-containing protein n=1 Tax=Paroceanicella profunda TaxID=2579971 RepID=A0A5B8FGD6_9RHOB|nr:class I SAM-dependent methyltransferase [Paroceanicella profunda]QDL90967.1 methyltransferase domain-containing protein [Paroceanicella profunda]